MYMDAFVFRTNMHGFTNRIETNGCEEKRATETAEQFLEPFDYKTAHMHDKQNHNEATTRSKPNDFPILTWPNGVPILTEILTAQPFFLYLTSPCLNNTPRRHSRISNHNSHSDSHECTALRPNQTPTKPTLKTTTLTTLTDIHTQAYTSHQEPAASPLTNDAHHPNGVSFVSFVHLHGIIILQGGCLQDLRTCLFPLLEPCQGQAPRPRLNDLRVNSVDTLDDSNRLFPLSPYGRGWFSQGGTCFNEMSM